MPHIELAARLPCLTTGTPAEAATMAAIVEMFTVLARSPPEPTTSTASWGSPVGVAMASMPSANDLISETVSPLARSATMNPASCAGLAFPARISAIAQSVSGAGKSSPWINRVSRSGQVNSMGSP